MPMTRWAFGHYEVWITRRKKANLLSFGESRVIQKPLEIQEKGCPEDSVYMTIT